MKRHRALLESVLTRQPAETCPVFLWKHHPEADQRADTLAAATLAFQDRFDCDLVKVSPAATYQLRDHGLEDSWRGDPIGRRSIERVVIHAPDDWRRLARLDPVSGFTGRLVDCAGLVRRHVPTSIPVTITVFNPLFQAVTLAGLDRLRLHLKECPDAVAEGLAILLENTLRLIEALAARHVDGIFFATQHVEGEILLADEYRRHGLAADLACLRAAEILPYTMFHLHGVAVHDALFHARAGMMLHYDPSLRNPRPEDLLADDIAVSTGPSPALLASDAPAPVLRAACEAILKACKGPAFVLSPGCSVPLAVGAERLDAVIAAARAPRPDRAALWAG